MNLRPLRPSAAAFSKAFAARLELAVKEQGLALLGPSVRCMGLGRCRPHSPEPSATLIPTAAIQYFISSYLPVPRAPRFGASTSDKMKHSPTSDPRHITIHISYWFSLNPVPLLVHFDLHPSFVGCCSAGLPNSGLFPGKCRYPGTGIWQLACIGDV